MLLVVPTLNEAAGPLITPVERLGIDPRLAPLIARALVKDPDILILDEPTSAMDSITEKPIFESLPPLVRKKTLIVVAHRLSTIQDSDSILLLSENRLVAAGTHQSLLESNAYYRSLVTCQQVEGAREETRPAASV